MGGDLPAIYGGFLPSQKLSKVRKKFKGEILILLDFPFLIRRINGR